MPGPNWPARHPPDGIFMTNPANPTPPAAGADGGPHAEPGDREEIYFEGSPPVRAYFDRVAIYAIISIVLIALGVMLLRKHIGPWWIGVLLFFIAFDLPWIPVIMAKRVRYRISNYRIDFERGLIARNIDTLELWHVEDMNFHQTMFNRILNVGTITILSRDETLPRLELRGIPNPRPLYETLKQRVIAVKRQRGVIKMDPG
jgi:hypothetical protein